MTLNKKVTIIIPALNESMVIGTIVAYLVKNIPGAEIIVVDDGSTDETGKLAAVAGARVIRHDDSYGYGAALRTGVLASEREYVLFSDADGQHAGSDVIHVLEACQNCDMVVGARGKESYIPLVRVPGKWILRRFTDFLAGMKIPDLNSGLRIVRRDVLLKYLHLMPRGFSFSSTTTFALLKGGYRIRWVPITVNKRVGQSSVKQWKHGPQTMLLILRLVVLFDPLRVFLGAAGFLFALTLFSLAVDIMSNHNSGQGIGDVTVSLFIATLLVFLFGLLCDQVSSMRRELHA